MKELTLSEIQIIPVKPNNGLVAFASAVLNYQFYIGNIAIYSSPSSKYGYRLVFPNKNLSNGKKIDCFHPIDRNAGMYIEKVIITKYEELMLALVDK